MCEVAVPWRQERARARAVVIAKVVKGDRAARAFVASADAGRIALAVDFQRAGPTDDEPASLRHVDAGIIPVEPPDVVRTFKDDRGVPEAVDASPRTVGVVRVADVDGRVRESHGRAGGDGHLVAVAVVVAARVCARHDRTVHGRHVAHESGEVAVPHGDRDGAGSALRHVA